MNDNEYFSDFNNIHRIIVIVAIIALFIQLAHKDFIRIGMKSGSTKEPATISKWVNLFYTKVFFYSNILFAILIALFSTINAIKSAIGYYIPLIWILFILLNTTYISYKIQKGIKKVYKSKYLWTLIVQISTILIFGVAIVFICHQYGITKETFLPFGIVATLLVWIFQDTVKGFISSFHLRANSMLHIGDWIEMPSQNIDGIVEDISLVNVTIKNWDESKSCIPLNQLFSNTYKNNRDVLSGKAFGRRMYRQFIIDTSSLRCVSSEEIALLRDKLQHLNQPTEFLEDKVPELTLNIYLFREYLINWLGENEQVSIEPRLFITLRDPKPEGIPLYINTFLKERERNRFEMEQSRIIDHILLSMQWFDLKLYQRPSAEDITGILTSNLNS